MIVLRPATDTAPKISLDIITRQVAGDLGPAFAAIDPWARYQFTAAALTTYLSEPEPQAPRFEIKSGDCSIGAVGIRQNWLRGPYLQFLAVLPGHQGGGIGALILRWFEAEARAKGVGNIWVMASDFNGDAIRFYERHGFQRIAVLDSLVKEGHDEILLRKRLPTA